jgi:hypothetical protein
VLVATRASTSFISSDAFSLFVPRRHRTVRTWSNLTNAGARRKNMFARDSLVTFDRDSFSLLVPLILIIFAHDSSVTFLARNSFSLLVPLIHTMFARDSSVTFAGDCLIYHEHELLVSMNYSWTTFAGSRGAVSMVMLDILRTWSFGGFQDLGVPVTRSFHALEAYHVDKHSVHLLYFQDSTFQVFNAICGPHHSCLLEVLS